jgi:acylpyruvate hydrolase
VIIRNIWCVGRNYADHAKELGNELPKTPMIFLKAGTCALNSGFALNLPAWTTNIHHEVELVFQFGEGLKFTRACIGLDLTLRDVQSQLQKDQKPWTLAKSFKDSAPIGNFFDLEGINPHEIKIRLTLNGEVRQECLASKMIFSPQVLSEYVLERFPVTVGDLLFTGTPQGVSPLKAGDVVLAEALRTGPDGDEVLSQGQWTVGLE